MAIMHDLRLTCVSLKHALYRFLRQAASLPQLYCLGFIELLHGSSAWSSIASPLIYFHKVIRLASRNYCPLTPPRQSQTRVIEL